MVNIHDVKTDKKDWAGDKLDAIFKRQRELMEKYHQIEKDNGLLQTEDVPVNIHHRMGQARLKDFAWRTTEELGEAIDAMDKYYGQIHPIDHCYEELADALHFLTEFSILADISAKDVVMLLELSDNWPHDNDKLETLFQLNPVDHEDPTTNIWDQVGVFVEKMGMACNCFKNKPWKKTEMMTDKKEFIYHVVQSWLAFIGICKVVGLTPETLTEYYFGKSEVNKFRQRSNY